MTPARWERIQELFLGAEERPEDERARWVAEQAGNDVDLIRQVENLLAAAGATGPILEQPILSAANELMAIAPLGPGAMLGPYQIVRALGQGGMGVVFLARRADRQFQQEVAIKLIQAWCGDSEMTLRFRTERQILAQLSHPNIARLLDGGLTPGGQPYLVMEYVDGPRIDEYCRANRVPLRVRLEMFRQICAGVQAAHQNLVVHRDIKPANILIAESGVPKLLDFGIAKLLDPQRMDHTVAVTRSTERLMTVEYASPEQVRGEPITTAADVYSLGVVLYELLTGVLPFERRTAAPAELERRVCEEEARRPSATSSKSSTLTAPDRGMLRGDLDNIVLKCIQKDPARRYLTASDLSEDIRRYLEGFPVLARPDAWTYRVRKFAGRHRWGVAAAAGFTTLIVASVLALAVFANRARIERDRAEQVSAFLIDLFQTSHPQNAQGRTITARELLDRGAAKVAQLGPQPEVKFKLLRTFGLVYEGLGDFSRSRQLLAECLTLARAVYGAGSLETAHLLKDLAELTRRGKSFAEAEAMARESLEIRRRKLGPDDSLTAESRNTLALIYQDAGEYEKAEPLFLELLHNRRVLRREPHLETAVLSNTGGNYHELGDYAAAVKYLSECVAIRRKELTPTHPRLALALIKLSGSVAAGGNLAEAAKLQAEALAIYEKVHGGRHPEVVRTLIEMGKTARLSRNFAAAELYLERAREVTGAIGGADTGMGPEFQLAQVRAGQGRLAEARRLMESVLAARTRGLGPEHVSTARARLALAQMELSLHNETRARSLLEEARRSLERKLPANHPDHRDIREMASRLAEKSPSR
ncbi:MAG: serine/threonine-protein kinase [Bryobacteraceae bacterium]|nr:serine/threonine-protein kinase [Bryobacteraceae bacterium]